MDLSHQAIHTIKLARFIYSVIIISQFMSFTYIQVLSPLWLIERWGSRYDAARPADWRFSSWRAITDQVRGGVSTAELDPDRGGARFVGTLDPSKLNAGFAGMNLDVTWYQNHLKLIVSACFCKELCYF